MYCFILTVEMLNFTKWKQHFIILWNSQNLLEMHDIILSCAEFMDELVTFQWFNGTDIILYCLYQIINVISIFLSSISYVQWRFLFFVKKTLLEMKLSIFRMINPRNRHSYTNSWCTDLIHMRYINFLYAQCDYHPSG